MLRRNGGTLTRAILCASAVGRLASGSPADQIVTGLNLLAGKLKLSALSDNDKSVKLQELTDSLAALTALRFEHLPDRLETDEAAKAIWQQASLDALRALQMSPNLTPGRQFDAALAQTWRDRFTRWFRDGVTVFSPTIQDLLTAVGPSPVPFVFPELDLADMTLQRWSTVLSLAVLGAQQPGSGAPASFVVPALWGLGFKPAARRIVGNPPANFIKGQEDRDAFALWSSPLQAQAQPRRGTILLVYSPGSGPEPFTASWIPSSRYAAFCFPALASVMAPSSILSVVSGVDLRRDFAVDTVMVELAADDPTIAKTLATPLKSLPPDILPLTLADPDRFRIVFLVPTALAATTGAVNKFIVAPSSLDDAMDRSAQL